MVHSVAPFTQRRARNALGLLRPDSRRTGAAPHSAHLSRRRLTWAALTAQLLLVPLLFTSPATWADEAAQRSALATFQQARGGDGSRIEAAAQQLQAVSRSAPGHPLWLAYAGSATALQARGTLLPWKKMSFTEDGLALIDKALALLTPAHAAELHDGVPVALETRLTAASTFLALPAMFNRAERGRRLLDELQKDPLLAGTPVRFQEAVRQLAATVTS